MLSVLTCISQAPEMKLEHSFTGGQICIFLLHSGVFLLSIMGSMPNIDMRLDVFRLYLNIYFSKEKFTCYIT